MTSKDPAVIFDIDGTLALRGDRDPFAWNRVGEDQPNVAVVELLAMIADDRHVMGILITSGRKEQCRRQTEMWLDAQGIFYDHLFMRGDDDNRPDDVFKAELYEREIAPKWDVRFVVDDRQKVVDMWRSKGLTVFQCAPGNF